MSLPSEPLAISSSTALVDRHRPSEETAFTEIFTCHQQMIYRVCLRYLGHHHDAEDVTQETFRRAALAMPKVDSQRPIEPWLVTIAANRCRTFLNRRQRDRLTDRMDDESRVIPTQSDSTHRIALEEQIDHALDRLPEHQRRAFELVHQRELSYPEAAGVMGRSTGTIKTWVHRAKLAMQNTLLAGNADPLPIRPSVSTTSASTERRHERSTAPRWIASAILFAGLYAGGRIASLPPDAPPIHLAATSETGTLPPMPAGSGPDENQFVAGETGVLNKPFVAPELSDAIDWQMVSLDAFSRARFTIDDIHSLPVSDWVDQSSPAIRNLRSGIDPLGRTLQRLVLLFQSEVAALDPPPASAPGYGAIDQRLPQGSSFPNTFSGEGTIAPTIFAVVS